VRRALVSLLVLGTLAGSGLARAESYQWTDKDGTVHFTDDPSQLPEPMRTQVLQRLEAERQKARGPAGAAPGRYDPIPPEARAERLPPAPVGGAPGRSGAEAPPPPEAAPAGAPPDGGSAAAPGEEPAAPAAAQGKEYWRGRLTAARQRVSELKQQCADLEARQQASSTQFLLFGHTAAQADGAQALELLEKCRAELVAAQRYLEDGLPEEARRAGALPGWLR